MKNWWDSLDPWWQSLYVVTYYTCCLIILISV